MSSPELPLSNVLVLDLTLARAGPTCVRHLADWGADVIRVEPPVPAGEDVVGRRHGTDFQNLHRNKRAIQLDLKSEAGHKVFERLVQRADVLVENMRPQVKHRLKVSYDDVKGINPAARLRQHQRIRPGRSVCDQGRGGPDRAGHGRAHVDHRHSGNGAGAGRHPDQRSRGGNPARLRHLHRALRTRAARARDAGSTRAFSKRRSSCSTSRLRAIS